MTMTSEEKLHLRFALLEAIWMTLENAREPGIGTKTLIADLHLLAHDGAKGRVAPESLNVLHWTDSLILDVERAILEINLRKREAA